METRNRTPETERRQATVVFTDITGFTALNERLDPEEAYEIVTACLMRLDAIARKHGGNVDKYLGDCILAVFGVPMAVEGAAQAALNAAIEMHESVEAFNHERGVSPPLRVHTGINTGLVISGEISGPVVREFSVMGDVVNVAARLKDAAPPDRIWLGPGTWEAARGVFEFQPLERMTLKGKEETIEVYELLSREAKLFRTDRSERPTLQSPLVGRSGDLQRLEAAIGALREGRGARIAVVGEAGIGKSRLVAELRERHPEAPPEWLFGRCVTIGSQLPYHPIVDLLRRWAGIATGDPPAQARASLRAATAPFAAGDSEDPFPLLATLVGVELEPAEAERIARLSDEALDRVLLRATATLLERKARAGPLVLAFEDLHWADRSSLGFLEALMTRLRDAPVLFLVITRPVSPGAPTDLQAILSGDTLDTIRLRPLEPGAAEQMLDHLCGDGDLAPALRERIEQRAAGNPFFLEEIVRALMDAGALERRGDGLHTTDRSASIELPTTVGELLAARLDRLDAESRNVIEIASVIGRSFRYGVLAALVPEARAGPALERLVAADLLQQQARSDHRRFAFKHPLIQETAYEILAHARRRTLHLRVAEAIEEVVEPDTPGYAGMLAYHFSLAAEPARAEAFLFRAGDDAARVAASSEALQFFQEAYRLYVENAGDGQDPEKLALLEQKIARACFNRGELAEASEHFNRALDRLGEPPSRGRLGLVWRLVSTLIVVSARLYLGRWLEGRRAASDRDREIIALMFDRSRAQTTGDPARFLLESMETIRRVGSIDPGTVPGAGGVFAGGMGTFSFSGLSLSLGERFLRRAEPLVDREDLREWFLFRFMRFSHHFLAGDWSEAYEIDPRDTAAALAAGQLWDVTTYLGLLADKKIFQARFERAGELLDQMGKIEAQYAYDLARSNRQFMSLLWELERGDLSAAERAAETHYRENDEAVLRVLSLGYLARIRCLREDLPGAEDALSRGEREIEQAGFVPPFELGAWVTARAQLDVEALRREGGAAGRQRRARRSVVRAVRLSRKVAWHRPEALRLEGAFHALAGHRRRSGRAFRRALRTAGALGMIAESARTWDEIARQLGTRRFDRRDANACRAEARRLRRAHELPDADRSPGGSAG